MSNRLPPAPPVADPRDTLDMLFAIAPNLLNQLNRIGGAADGQPIPLYDQNVGYDDVFRNTGAYPEWLNQLLGLVAGVGEPGPGELGQAARLARDLAPALGVAFRPGILQALGGTDDALDVWRAQFPNGAGAYSGEVADSAYWATDVSEAVSSQRAYPGTEVVPGRLPLDPNRVLDITDDAAFREALRDPTSGAARFQQWAHRLQDDPNLTDGARRRIGETLADWQNGMVDTPELVYQLRREMGHDAFAGGLRGAEFDALIQLAEDNAPSARRTGLGEVVELNRGFIRRGGGGR